MYGFVDLWMLYLYVFFLLLGLNVRYFEFSNVYQDYRDFFCLNVDSCICCKYN